MDISIDFLQREISINTSGRYGKSGQIAPNHVEEVVSKPELENVWILLKIKLDVQKRKRSLQKLVGKALVQVYPKFREKALAILYILRISLANLVPGFNFY